MKSSSLADAVGRAPYPPRPRAIATFLASDDFLPGCQTLLHSVKKHLPTKSDEDKYPPELVVLLSSKVSNAAVKSKLKFFCDRIITVDHIPINQKSVEEKNQSHVKKWDENCGWTKLRLFELEGYDTILYIDADCLVVNDVSHLLDVETSEPNNSEAGKRVGLLAAAPDIFPPDKFNAGVMVLRPSKSVFDDMMLRLPRDCDFSNGSSNQQSEHCKSYDGGDTGFLNSYYPHWFQTMPSYSRLSFGYNAQRFMHHCTFDKQPKYWNDGIDDLRVIHFSSSPKPWERPRENKQMTGKVKDASELVAGDEIDKIQQSNGVLDKMWQTAFEQSQQYYKKETRKQQALKSASNPSNPGTSAAKPKAKLSPHQMVQRRYKELRKEGYSTSRAMQTARDEYGMNQEYDPRRAVGQMFGL